mmetsp:Transcript_90787/g.246123  ORF Transcript_90787/g.246123 Transcript_90787/m.246123 type:complete len:81 (-) Transcript_90787:695-937(-)
MKNNTSPAFLAATSSFVKRLEVNFITRNEAKFTAMPMQPLTNKSGNWLVNNGKLPSLMRTGHSVAADNSRQQAAVSGAMW